VLVSAGAEFKTAAFDSLIIIGGAFPVGGGAGYIAAVTAQSIAPDVEISRLEWGNEAGLSLSALALIGVATYWITAAFV
jgi:hypothetical protein